MVEFIHSAICVFAIIYLFFDLLDFVTSSTPTWRWAFLRSAILSTTFILIQSFVYYLDVLTEVLN